MRRLPSLLGEGAFGRIIEDHDSAVVVVLIEQCRLGEHALARAHALFDVCRDFHTIIYTIRDSILYRFTMPLVPEMKDCRNRRQAEPAGVPASASCCPASRTLATAPHVRYEIKLK